MKENEINKEQINASLQALLEKFSTAVDGKVVIDKATFEGIQANKIELEAICASKDAEIKTTREELKTTKEQLEQATASVNANEAEKIVAKTVSDIIAADQERIIAEKNQAIENESRKAVLLENGISSEKIVARSLKLATKEDFNEYVAELIEARNMSFEVKNAAERQAILAEQAKLEQKIEIPNIDFPADPQKSDIVAQMKTLAQDTAAENKEQKVNNRKQQSARN